MYSQDITKRNFTWFGQIYCKPLGVQISKETGTTAFFDIALTRLGPDVLAVKTIIQTTHSNTMWNWGMIQAECKNFNDKAPSIRRFMQLPVMLALEASQK